MAVLVEVIAHISSGAQALAEMARGARVVSAFGTIPSEVLFHFSDRAGGQ